MIMVVEAGEVDRAAGPGWCLRRSWVDEYTVYGNNA